MGLGYSVYVQDKWFLTMRARGGSESVQCALSVPTPVVSIALSFSSMKHCQSVVVVESYEDVLAFLSIKSRHYPHHLTKLPKLAFY